MPAIKKSLSTVEDDKVAEKLWRSLLGNKGAGKSLAAQIDSSDQSAIKQPIARIGLRIASQRWRENQSDLIDALTPLCGETKATVEMTPERIKAMAVQATKTGRPLEGELIYRRENWLAYPATRSVV